MATAETFIRDTSREMKGTENMPDVIVPITKARANLSGLVDRAQEEPVFIVRRSSVDAVMLSTTAYENLLDRLEYLSDSLDALTTDGSDAEPFVRESKRELASA